MGTLADNLYISDDRRKLEDSADGSANGRDKQEAEQKAETGKEEREAEQEEKGGGGKYRLKDPWGVKVNM